MFIRYYLTLTAPTPKAEQDASRIIGNQRFEAFVTQVGRRLASGIPSMSEAMDKPSQQEPDFQHRDTDKSVAEEAGIDSQPSSHSPPQPDERGR
jgi:hypothetical protein